MIDHETKLAILSILKSKRGERIPAAEIARRLGTTHATISRHLTELLDLDEIWHCVLNHRKYYFVPTEAEISAAADTSLPNWKTAKEYKYPLAMQRRVKEIAEHRARFPLFIPRVNKQPA
jgi:DNA-binding IclR family transcriptional regulator